MDKKKIVMDTIKVAGSYDIEIKIYPEVSTKMKVIIIAAIIRRTKFEGLRRNKYREFIR